MMKYCRLVLTINTTVHRFYYSSQYCNSALKQVVKKEPPHNSYIINPFTPELKKCILPTFQKAIVWVM